MLATSTTNPRSSAAVKDVAAESSESNDDASAAGTLSSGDECKSVDDAIDSEEKQLQQAKIERQNSSFDSHSWGNGADFAPDKTNNPQEEFELPAARNNSLDSGSANQNSGS